MNIKRKSEYIGALGALLVHVAIIALLILVSFAIPHPDEEAGGVPVMMGDVDAAYGNYDPSTMVDVEVLPEEVPAPQPECRSVSKLCVIPMQDYLGYDNRARINQPSTLGKNWKWRLNRK